MKLRTIGIFIMSLVIGFSIIVQSRVTNGQQLYVSAKAISDYQTTIASEQEDMKRIYNLVEDAKVKLSEYETLAENEDRSLQDKLLEDLDYYKLISGAAKVHGEGVIVYIDDGTRELYEGEDPNAVLVHDMDILTIINELNRSGAEVLSVNGQRITNMTSISCSGYTIRINDQFFARPFEIRAIGDSKRMAAALIGPEGYGTLLKDYGVIFKLTIEDDLIISKYSEEQKYEYMTKVKEGE
ncbi:DUF881 domain-containing protein [Sinanaerobacter chloroacetimidivorans]|jgi:uncharacterized protein YlxW (UPF0749 family)|uniref:DUF881 domain-containing protein n=1 Tax=Sinanaerobacter chloroacetimidivorans TaxID=2818044 RepID=A0A8J7W0M9_9FIRM|nr:DUF881 domain-containing protein [Sinanaerobacter chloroacetimidivorans]MBR0597060.1 DUF881 domain-containing protein [Sinanaerobacter chloroacetimidivorans]